MKIFKKILTVSLAFLIACSLFSCTWEDITITPDGSPVVIPGETAEIEKLTSDGAGGLAFSESAEGYVVTGYHGTIPDVFIPRTWNGRPVVGINTNAFYENKTANTIIITSSVKSISKHAFKGDYTIMCESKESDVSWDADWYDGTYKTKIEWECGNVGSFAWETIPNETATTVDDDIIITKYIENPVDLIIPEKIANRTVVAIARDAFNGCSSLKTIKLPATINQIGSFAFRFCTELTSIELPENLTVIPSYMFENCSSLKSVKISSITKEIGTYAFANCPSLEEIKIPSTTTSMGNYVFQNNRNIKIYLDFYEQPQTWSSSWNQSIPTENIYYKDRQ